MARVQHALALQQLLESVTRLFFDQIPQIIFVESQLLRQHFQRKHAVIFFDDRQRFRDDLILVGTPAFSRPVEAGSTVVVEVEGLGRLENTIVEADIGISPDFGAQPSESDGVQSVALGSDFKRKPA